jgi:hypothetical protein
METGSFPAKHILLSTGRQKARLQPLDKPYHTRMKVTVNLDRELLDRTYPLQTIDMPDLR